MTANENKNRICIEGKACDKFHTVVGDMLETIESLRTAATAFPKASTTDPGEMNASITVNAFTGVISKQLDQLYALATGMQLEPWKEGGS